MLIHLDDQVVVVVVHRGGIHRAALGGRIVALAGELGQGAGRGGSLCHRHVRRVGRLFGDDGGALLLLLLLPPSGGVEQVPHPGVDDRLGIVKVKRLVMVPVVVMVMMMPMILPVLLVVGRREESLAFLARMQKERLAPADRVVVALGCRPPGQLLVGSGAVDGRVADGTGRLLAIAAGRAGRVVVVVVVFLDLFRHVVQGAAVASGRVIADAAARRSPLVTPRAIGRPLQVHSVVDIIRIGSALHQERKALDGKLKKN